MVLKFDRSKKEKLENLIALVVKMYDPERIILFGSQARGDWNEDSDFDLLVVNSSINMSIAHIYSESAKAKIDLCFDCLRTNTADLEHFKKSTNHVLAHAQREGVDIYRKSEKILI